MNCKTACLQLIVQRSYFIVSERELNVEEVGTAPEELRREEKRVEGHSAVFKKELGLADLVLTQIVFVVGTIWVGTAAKLGGEQLFFWLLAIATFYLPLAAVVIYLNRLMPLEGGDRKSTRLNSSHANIS